MYPVSIWISFGGEAPNNDRQRCTTPKTMPLGGLHVLHRVTLLIYWLQEITEFMVIWIWGMTVSSSGLCGIDIKFDY